MSGKKMGLLILMLVAMLLVVGSGVGAARPKLSVWMWGTFSDALNDYYQLKTLEWAMENDVEIDFVVVPGGGTFVQKITVAVAAGNPPDVVIHGQGLVTSIADEILIPLDDVVDKLGRDDFMEGILAPFSLEGHIYALPVDMKVNLLHQRADVLADAGIAIPDHWSWDELAEAARKVNNPEKDFYGLAFSLGGQGDVSVAFCNLLFSYGGGILTEKSVAGADIVKQAPTYKALQWLKDRWDEGLIPPDSPGWTDSGNNNAFITGRGAFAYQAATIYFALTRTNRELAAKTELGVLGEGLYGTGLAGVFKTTAYPDLAKDLLYYTFKDKEDYRKMCTGTALYAFPAFKSTMEALSKEYKDGMWRNLSADPGDIMLAQTKNWQVGTYPLGQFSPIQEEAYTGRAFAKAVYEGVVEGDIEKAVSNLHQFVVEAVQRRYED